MEITFWSPQIGLTLAHQNLCACVCVSCLSKPNALMGPVKENWIIEVIEVECTPGYRVVLCVVLPDLTCHFARDHIVSVATPCHTLSRFSKDLPGSRQSRRILTSP